MTFPSPTFSDDLNKVFFEDNSGKYSCRKLIFSLNVMKVFNIHTYSVNCERPRFNDALEAFHVDFQTLYFSNEIISCAIYNFPKYTEYNYIFIDASPEKIIKLINKYSDLKAFI